MTVETDQRRRREQAIDDLVRAINRGDVAGAVAAMAHPRIELVGQGRVYDGAEAVERYLHDRGTAFPDQQYELIALHHADDAVIAEFWMTGTLRGEVDGMPATGRGFRCRMACFFLFQGDRLVGQRLYFDLGTIARQLA